MSDVDEVEGGKWEAWNRLLAGVAGRISCGGFHEDDTLERVYDLAMELRDRLRYCQGRLRSVKQELAAAVGGARAERQEALLRLQELELEVARLGAAVQAQGMSLTAKESSTQSQAFENEHLRRRVALLESQLQRAEEDRLSSLSERNEALHHLDTVTRLLEESESRIAEAQAEQSGLLGELVATKERLAGMCGLGALYGAAREELGRLEGENAELRDMLEAGAGGQQLGRSRILEALGSLDDAADALFGRSGQGAAGDSAASTPAGATASGGGGGGGGGGGRSRSAPRSRRRASAVGLTSASSPGPASPRVAFASSSPSRVRSARAGATATTAASHNSGANSGSGTSREERQPPAGEEGEGVPLEDLLFLGPPSSAYPPDPENYVFHRVGGGYSPRLDPQQPTTPLPRASGWVPRDVVRLVQAFRRSYSLPLPWRHWEPLLLLVDELYRGRAEGSRAAARAAQREKVKAYKRQLCTSLPYPSALAAAKLAHLQRQLGAARKSLAQGDMKGDVPLKRMAVKDYHLGYQLDRAVDENYALRRCLADLHLRYSSACDTAAATAEPGMTAPALSDYAGAASPSPPPPPAVAAAASAGTPAKAVAAAETDMPAARTASDIYSLSPANPLSFRSGNYNNSYNGGSGNYDAARAAGASEGRVGTAAAAAAAAAATSGTQGFNSPGRMSPALHPNINQQPQPGRSNSGGSGTHRTPQNLLRYTAAAANAANVAAAGSASTHPIPLVSEGNGGGYSGSPRTPWMAPNGLQQQQPQWPSPSIAASNGAGAGGGGGGGVVAGGRYAAPAVTTAAVGSPLSGGVGPASPGAGSGMGANRGGSTGGSYYSRGGAISGGIIASPGSNGGNITYNALSAAAAGVGGGGGHGMNMGVGAGGYGLASNGF